MRKRPPTHSDIINNPPNDIMKFYRWTNKQYEAFNRKNTFDGANQKEMREGYEKIYPMNRSDR